jgi:hypothetical protein
MLPAKKVPLARMPYRSLKKELDFLYARRSAIDTLIESLQGYRRFKVGCTRRKKQKSLEGGL